MKEWVSDRQASQKRTEGCVVKGLAPSNRENRGVWSRVKFS